MALIHLIPVSDGLVREEVGQRLQSGWILAGRQAINVQGVILDPSKPMSPTGVADYDVWVLPEATMPVGLIAKTLVDTYKPIEQGSDPGDACRILLLDDLARKLFGAGILVLVEQVDQMASAAEAKTEDKG